MQPTDNLHAYYAAHAPAVPDWFPPLRKTEKVVVPVPEKGPSWVTWRTTTHRENPLDHLVRWRHEYAAAMVKKGASQ